MSDDAFETVMGPLLKVRERAGEVLAGHGLVLRVFSVMPGVGVDGPHEFQLIATLADDTAASDGEFERVVAEARDAEVRLRADQARDDLVERLRNPGGFLD